MHWKTTKKEIVNFSIIIFLNVKVLFETRKVTKNNNQIDVFFLLLFNHQDKNEIK